MDSLQAAIDVNLNALVHDLHDRNQAIARVEKQIELEARLLGDLNDSMKVAVGINVESQAPSPEVKTLARPLTPDQARTLREWMIANGGSKDRISS